MEPREDDGPGTAYDEYENGVRPSRRDEYTAGPLVHKYEDGRRDGVRLAVIHEEDGPFVREYEDGTAYGWPSYARRTVRRTAGRRT